MGQVVAVCDAMAVGDDQGWTVVGFRFLEGLDRVHVLRADGDASHVHRSIAYGFHRNVLLAGGLAGSGKLRYCSARRCLRHLSAGVGVGLGIEHEDLDVLARCQAPGLDRRSRYRRPIRRRQRSTRSCERANRQSPARSEPAARVNGRELLCESRRRAGAVP